MHLRRRILGFILATLFVSITAAGCIPRGPAVPFDTMVIGVDGNAWDQFDPFLAKDRPTRNVLANVFEGLVRADASGHIMPLLAERWQQVDPLTWEFTLRSGVHFQDDTPFTPADAVFSIMQAMAESTNGPFGTTLAPITDVSASGQVIRIVTNKPYPLLLAALAQVPVVSRARYQIPGDGRQAVGTGLFRLVRHSGDTAELERWDGYWNTSISSATGIRHVIFRLIPGAATREAMLEQGQLQLIQGVPAADAGRLKGQGLQVMTVAGTMINMVELNTMKPPLDRAEARRALNYAIDYNEVIRKLYGGLGVRLAGPLLPGSLGESPRRAPYTYDPNLARSLWTQAGGTGTVFVIDTVPARASEADLIAGMLNDAGIRAQVQVWADAGALRQAIVTGERMAYLTQWGEASLDPYEVLVPKLRAGGLYNYSFYANRDVDDLIDEATVSTDQSRRAALYGQAENQIIQDAPWVFGYVLEACEAAGPDVQGYQARRDGLVILAGVSRKAPGNR